MSPYLFVIAMEALTQIMKVEVATATKFKYHWRCKKQDIIQLGFVDDLLLFCHGNLIFVPILGTTMERFLNLSSMMANAEKSHIFMAGIQDEVESQIKQCLGFVEGTLPIRCFRVPLISSKFRPNDCDTLIDKTKAMIKSWINKSLSFAGRLQLVQAVLYNIQSY